jgi:hypothetical protein
VIRAEKFLISRPLYAVDLGGYERHDEGGTYLTWPAVWYRRKSGVTAACAGVLWDVQRTPPADSLAALAAHEDGRYGGRCRARWDGKRYWFDPALTPEQTREYEALLAPMLAAYPEIPAGFEGWYGFNA